MLWVLLQPLYYERVTAFKYAYKLSTMVREHIQEEIAPLHSYLPHAKYIKKVTKQHIQKKKEAIQFMKVDKNQVAKAVHSLQQYYKATAVNHLFSSQPFIYLQICLDVMVEHSSIRPVQIPLPIPIYSKEYNSRLAIIVSDPSLPFIEKIQQIEVPLLSQVINYDAMKRQYKLNNDKMKLLARNDLFFCDWRIYNLLKQPLGKMFYDKKKYPFPIDCEGVPENIPNTTYEQYLNSLTHSTYCMMGVGPVFTIKIARVNMEVSDVVKNVIRGVYRAIPHILGQHLALDKVRQISLKLYNSCSLPIYQFVSKAERIAYKHYLKSTL